MESLIARWLLLLCFILGVVGQATITNAPQNAAQYVGDNVTLVCEFQESGIELVWSECITKAPVCTPVFRDGAVYPGAPTPPERYSVVDNTGPSGKKYDFVITGVQTADGGQFRCDNGLIPDPAYAEVIVLGSDMKCSNNLTSGSEVELGDFIYLSSDVTFHGRWPPVARFRSHDNTVLPGRVNETSSVTAKYSVVLAAVKGLQGQTLSAEWYFDVVNGTATGEATNTPNFTTSNTCSSQPITVYYPPEGLTIAPEKDSYPVGETITCTAQGNPVPGIQWINMNDSSVTVDCPAGGSCQLEVSQDWLGTTATYRCQPCNNYFSVERCIFQDVTFTTVTTTTSSTTPSTTTATTPSTIPEVTGTPTPTPTGQDNEDKPLSSAVIGAIAACCAVVVAIIIVLIVICCMKKRKKEAAAARSPANTNKPIHGDAVRTTHMVNDQPPAPAPFPDEKVGYDPYSAPYSHHNYPDTEAPSHDPQNRNEEGLHYADLALEDVPRSRKPIQVLEPSGTEYAEIRRA